MNAPRLSHRFTCIAVALVAAFGAAQATAQADFPTRTIRLVTPHSPGSSSDTLSRAIADQMSNQLKPISVTVENKEGAAGVVAAQFVKGQPPDGYTILMVVPALVFAPMMQKTPAYDFQTSFTPVIKVAENPYILFSSSSKPFKTWPELVEYGKKNPDKLSYGGSGRGGQPHLGTEVLKKLYGFEAQEIQYKRITDGVVDLATGRIDFFLLNTPPMKAQMDLGTVKPIAVASTKRLKLLPDVPTFAELGKPFDYSAWFAIVAPAGTPPETVKKLSAMIARAVDTPAVRDKIENGLTGLVTIEDSQALAALIKSDSERYRKLIADLQITE